MSEIAKNPPFCVNIVGDEATDMVLLEGKPKGVKERDWIASRVCL